MRITLCIYGLGLGGAQKIILNLGRLLISDGHQVTLWTSHPNTPDFYQVPEGITRARTQNRNNCSCRWFDIRCQLSRIAEIRRSILNTQPELIISFIDTTNIAVLVAMNRTDIPIIVSERVHPAPHKIGLFWTLLRRIYYKRSKFVITVTQSAAEYFSFLPESKLKVIPNIVDKNICTNELKAKVIIAAGRLTRQKGFDLLIEAFNNLLPENPDWKLYIYGEGEIRDELENLIAKNSLEDKVLLPGKTNNLNKEFQDASIFVLSSRYEGFPNALAEAMAAGLAVVSFDCLSGPSDLITHNENGLLLPENSVKDLTKALSNLMNDPNQRLRLGNNAKSITTKFSEAEIIEKWRAVISAAINN